MNANKQDAGGLLPCPFCGGEPIQYDYADGYGIHCGNVECTIDMFATSRDSDADARAIWNRRNGELCRAAPAGGDDHLRRLVGKLDQWRLSMSYNDSYFGEPAGLLKSTVEELARAVGPIYPPKPAPKDPLAGVTIYSATVTLSAAARDGE